MHVRKVHASENTCHFSLQFIKHYTKECRYTSINLLIIVYIIYITCEYLFVNMPRFAILARAEHHKIIPFKFGSKTRAIDELSYIIPRQILISSVAHHAS